MWSGTKTLMIHSTLRRRRRRRRSLCNGTANVLVHDSESLTWICLLVRMCVKVNWGGSKITINNISLSYYFHILQLYCKHLCLGTGHHRVVDTCIYVRPGCLCAFNCKYSQSSHQPLILELLFKVNFKTGRRL